MIRRPLAWYRHARRWGYGLFAAVGFAVRRNGQTLTLRRAPMRPSARCAVSLGRPRSDPDDEPRESLRVPAGARGANGPPLGLPSDRELTRAVSDSRPQAASAPHRARRLVRRGSELPLQPRPPRPAADAVVEAARSFLGPRREDASSSSSAVSAQPMSRTQMAPSCLCNRSSSSYCLTPPLWLSRTKWLRAAFCNVQPSRHRLRSGSVGWPSSTPAVSILRPSSSLCDQGSRLWRLSGKRRSRFQGHRAAFATRWCARTTAMQSARLDFKAIEQDMRPYDRPVKSLSVTGGLGL